MRIRSARRERARALRAAAHECSVRRQRAADRDRGDARTADRTTARRGSGRPCHREHRRSPDHARIVRRAPVPRCEPDGLAARVGRTAVARGLVLRRRLLAGDAPVGDRRRDGRRRRWLRPMLSAGHAPRGASPSRVLAARPLRRVPRTAAPPGRARSRAVPRTTRSRRAITRSRRGFLTGCRCGLRYGRWRRASVWSAFRRSPCGARRARSSAWCCSAPS